MFFVFGEINLLLSFIFQDESGRFFKRRGLFLNESNDAFEERGICLCPFEELLPSLL
jgi:hypothetical protein